MQNDVLATGIMSFVMHEIVYFGRSLPWIIIDAIPFFNRYKIQNVRDGGYVLRCQHGSADIILSKKYLLQKSNGTVPG